LEPGEADTGNDFVDVLPDGSISGNVSDEDGNPLENVTIQLLDSNSTPVATTTTNGDGNYTFTDVEPGNYSVQETNLPDYENVSEVDGEFDGGDDTDGGNNGIPDNIPVILEPGEADTGNDFVDVLPDAGIDIEKFTNGVDADTIEEAVEISPGKKVTWTYEVTNTGDVSFKKNEIQVHDDIEGEITNIVEKKGGNNNNKLEPGETWIYQKTGTAQDLSTTTSSQDITFHLTGNSSTTGHYGNVRTFTQDGVSVDVSAFSSNKHGGNWKTAYLGAYGGGLGVTNRKESGHNHLVDNDTSNDYVLFEFDQQVTVDRAFLNYVKHDSDITVWIGERNGDITHLNSDILNGFTKENNNGGKHDRWANFNADELTGDTIVISARQNQHNDAFKLKKLDISVPGETTIGNYVNIGTVTAGSVSDEDQSGYTNPEGEPEPQNPGIDIEKFTNGVDADTIEEAVEISPGKKVTWTYEVTNTGDVSFKKNEIQVHDDIEGEITNIVEKKGGNNNNKLEPGETWIYQKTGTAQDLSTTTSSQDITFHLTGNSSTTGHYGNVRTFTQDGVSVDVSAFSSNKHGGNWKTAYLGAYGGGLGVTNRKESGHNHLVDNDTSNDYVLFEFDQQVTVDRAFLNYVKHDSDITVWIGERNGDITHLNSDILNGFTKENNNGGKHDRWANFNADELTGDTIVISARQNQHNDAFKLKKLDISVPGETTIGNYVNIGTVTAGSVSDEDQSGYTNPGQNSLLFSLKDHKTLDGISFKPEDIVEYNLADQSFTKFFDGSDVGIDHFNIDAFEVISDNEILLSFKSAQDIGGIHVDDSDIVKFTATSLGENTAGSFDLYFDGSDVGLSKGSENIDGLSVDPVTGDLLISTQGNVKVPGVNSKDEDILRFKPDSLGSHTSGSWSVEFDGSDVGLSDNSEDVDAIGLKGEQILLSTTGNFSVTGLSGNKQDVFAFNPNTLGTSTSGTFEELFTELNNNDISGVHFLG
ncbi:carboxypeptidase-like regulatory domain-containing protein, partial [Dapis sp. BLCC M229]|uniref:carboxypeptidase-like regulatory domain-containing protein n=1 Tax=Dapis sp. BLCC M229 TaxID=3400188 RepID=UPI003CF73F1E